MAASGLEILVGHPTDSSQAAGRVHVYEQQGGGWAATAVLVALDPAPFEGFGADVALEQDRALVGTAGDAGDDLGNGSAYLFERTAIGWVQAAKLQSADSQPGDAFGSAVALAGNAAAIGAWAAEDDPASNFDSGKVYFYAEPFAGCPFLSAAPSDLSVGAGGVQVLDFTTGSLHASQLYFVAGSASGTAPGLVFDQLSVALAPDPYFHMTLKSPAASPLIGSLGLLDSQGSGQASWVLAPGAPPVLVGLQLHHACGVLDTQFGRLRLVSQPVPLTLGP